MIAINGNNCSDTARRDNVVAARVLGFDHVVDYVFYHHAPITIPALIVIGIVHYFWQRYMDKRQAGQVSAEIDEANSKYVI